ncbi:hypothetical protein O3M35_002484 [Rhynocoris fuscipes]|uniref:MADF domain-containing protein n=1 Tax=Rhynocoris fuscipes TaxID=488301 RepID=A0AAW1CSA0_9HEMI
MPLLCCVRNCKTNYEEHLPGTYTAFFKFPKDPILRNKWIENIGRPNWKPNLNSALCIKHFTSDCIIEIAPQYHNVNGQYILSNRVIKLKQGACPTIFKVPIAKLSSKRKLSGALLQSNEVIDLIDDPLPSVSVVTNQSTTPLVLSTPQKEIEISEIPKSEPIQSNNNISKILLLDDFKKTQGKTEEESEFIIDEVTANLEEDLITAVYNREPLWRINKENQPDENCLDSLWKEVAEEVGRSVLIVKEIWESLRYRFFQEQKVVEKSKFTYWPYYNQLWFLKLNNITAEQQIAGTTSNEIIPTSTNNSIVPKTENNQPTTNGIIYPATVVNLVAKPDIVLTATNNIIPTTNNILNGSVVTLAPILTTRTTVGATSIPTTNIVTTNLSTTNVVTTNLSTTNATITTTNTTTTNVLPTNITTNQTSNINNTVDCIKSNEIIILDDDEDANEEEALKQKRQKLMSKFSSKKQQNGILKNLLTDRDEDLAYLKRILPRIKALSYNNRMKFRDDVLNSLRSLENLQKQSMSNL